MLEKQINDAFIEAYKSKDKDEVMVGTLRMIKSVLANKKIEKLIAKEELLADDEVIAVLKSEIKKRLDSIESYQVGNRPELAAAEKKEIDIIAKFLPEQLSEEKVRELVKETIAELGNPGPVGFGKVMSATMAKAKGLTDGNVVSKIVKEELA